MARVRYRSMQTVRSFCRVCTSVCGILVDVEGDEVIRGRGDQDHPFSHGYTCPKGRALPQLHHHSDRLERSQMRVGSRLQESHTRVVEMSTQQVEQRVAHALLRLAKQSGRKVDHGVEIDFPISRQDIAQMTGTTLHTVSRILSGWEQAGLVESGRQRIVLREPHKIFVLAEQAPGDGAAR